MLTQSISNSLLKEFVRRNSEVNYAETDNLNQLRSVGIKREVKSSPLSQLSEHEYEGPSPKYLRTHDYDLKHINNASSSDTMQSNTTKSFMASSHKDILVRNYSDIMRNLAAKYNSTFQEDQLKYISNGTSQMQSHQMPKSKNTPLNYENNFLSDPTANTMSLLTGLSLSSGIIPHMLDMSSTQALITLVRKYGIIFVSREN